MSMKATMMYAKVNDKYIYYDKNGNILRDGDTVIYNDGREEKLYETEEGFLGTDATNRHWIETGRAVPCEYGVYPLEYEELKEVVKKDQ